MKTINMDAWFQENGWSMEDALFKTDHHWKPQAALAAANCTMELLASEGLAYYDETLLDDSSWTVTSLENWLLGSSGKRTGVTYAGTDDILVYIPDFETDYAYSYLTRNTTTWTYTDTILNLHYLEAVDYFNDNPYHIYMIGDYPLRNTVNTKASNKKRVLIMGDSFKIPFEYFLTTQFEEVYTIDLRYYTDGTLAQYVEELEPDIVLMCTYAYTLGADSTTSLYSFGVEEYCTALEETAADEPVIELGTHEIAADENSDQNFKVLYSNLEEGQTYTLTLEETTLSGGEDSYLQMTLQDLSTNTAVYNHYFEANSEESQKWILTVPEGTDDTYAIYLYAGTKGNTSNISVSVSELKLQKGVLES